MKIVGFVTHVKICVNVKFVKENYHIRKNITENAKIYSHLAIRLKVKIIFYYNKIKVKKKVLVRAVLKIFKLI